MLARRPAAGPAVAALMAVAIVVLVALVSRSGTAGPVPPDPVRLLPAPLDQGGQSLDRCAIALDSAGLASGYPHRADWRPLAVLFTGDVFVTLLDDEVPFVCVTGPRTVEVSAPSSAVPIDTALLLLTTPSGVLAAVAPAQERVEVTATGDPPSVGPTRYFLRVTGGPITDVGQLAVAIAGPAGLRTRGPPQRLALPALHHVDRPWVPGERPTSAVDLLRRCQAARTEPEAVSRRWRTAHVLTYQLDGQPASLLVAISSGAVGGCSVTPEEVTPLQVWRVGTISDGVRPFVWLPAPGQTLPDLDPDFAAGLVEPGVERMLVVADQGQSWVISVVGGTFATRIPPGVTHDPRALTVRAFDADDQLIYEGAAAD